MFVTAFYAILNILTGELVYCNAGHNQPVACLSGEKAKMLPLTGGMALGVMPGYAYAERTLQLSGGDSLFFYTDGVTEAMNRAGELWGDQRLVETCERLRGLEPEAVVVAVSDALAAFVGEAEPSDDITMMALRYFG